MKRFFMIFAIALSALSAAAQTSDDNPMTVAEFRNLPDSDTTWHILTGIVSTVRNENYGSFYIKDATGEVLIFGLWDAQGMGAYMRHRIRQGDTLSVSGRRSIYDFRVVEMKNAFLREFRPAAPSKKGRGRRK